MVSNSGVGAATIRYGILSARHTSDFDAGYRKTTNISWTSVSKRLVDHSAVVGASSVCIVPIISSC